MHSDDIPEEVYLMMAQDMLLRHRGDATDEVVRVLPSASDFAAGTPKKQSPGARPLTQRLAAATQDLHAPSADFAEYGIHNIEDGGVALSKMGELLHGRLNSAAERLLAVIEQCS
jgi:hypothetical protein